LANVTFILADGTRQVVDIPEGRSVMLGATQGAVNGIDADCGGACACATCHVYVDPEWLGRLEPRSDVEATMLDFAVEPTETSRLSCQIIVKAELEGLVVTVPKSQY
jgi:ferredoxin, 2Fe-2S